MSERIDPVGYISDDRKHLMFGFREPALLNPNAADNSVQVVVTIETAKRFLENLQGALAVHDEWERNRHWSDCALNNGPALEPGPCDCGAAASASQRIMEAD